MQPKTVAESVQKGTHGFLWCGVLAANAGHVPTASGRAQTILAVQWMAIAFWLGGAPGSVHESEVSGKAMEAEDWSADYADDADSFAATGLFPSDPPICVHLFNLRIKQIRHAHSLCISVAS